MFHNLNKLTEPTFESYKNFINTTFENEFNSIFLSFMKNYFFNDSFSIKTELRTFTDLHKYSIQNADSLEQYLDNLDFYAQAIMKTDEDYKIVQQFIHLETISEMFSIF